MPGFWEPPRPPGNFPDPPLFLTGDSRSPDLQWVVLTILSVEFPTFSVKGAVNQA